MTGIHHTIAAAVDDQPSASAATIAAAVMKACAKADLLPLVVEAVEGRQRSVTRRMERAVTIKRLRPLVDAGRAQTLPASTPDQDRVLALLRRAWRLGDGTTVEIGRASVDEVRHRLDLLRKQRDGLNESIAVLEAIERELVRTGAPCLNDLVGVAA